MDHFLHLLLRLLFVGPGGSCDLPYFRFAQLLQCSSCISLIQITSNTLLSPPSNQLPSDWTAAKEAFDVMGFGGVTCGCRFPELQVVCSFQHPFIVHSLWCVCCYPRGPDLASSLAHSRSLDNIGSSWNDAPKAVKLKRCPYN